VGKIVLLFVANTLAFYPNNNYQSKSLITLTTDVNAIKLFSLSLLLRTKDLSNVQIGSMCCFATNTLAYFCQRCKKCLITLTIDINAVTLIFFVTHFQDKRLIMCNTQAYFCKSCNDDAKRFNNIANQVD
jgi:uncharacterized protein (UPF0333 family)